jgi:glyoxylase-like metal-dependent hydrolase (beta-lactamase superfamily II)
VNHTEPRDEMREPTSPGWQRLPQFVSASNPLFDSLWALPGYEGSANSYVIAGPSLAIIDPGNDYTALMELWKLGFRPDGVKKIAITHGHLDHVMGALELVRSYPEVLQDGGFEMVLHEASPREIKESIRQFGCRVTEVRGGETVELGGFPLEVIHTPGHTIDGICWYHAPTRSAFTGDTVLPDAMAAPDDRAGGKLEHYLLSIRSLLEREIENILPGHGLPVAGAGRHVIEQTYESLMLKAIGVEDKISWMTGATALAERGLLEEAIFCCDREIARNPDNAAALQLKTTSLNDLGRAQEALVTLEQLARIPGPTQHESFVLVGKGYALMGLGRYQESVDAFDSALALNPANHDVLIYKGMALYLAGRYDEAMSVELFQKEFVKRFKDELTYKKAPVS